MCLEFACADGASAEPGSEGAGSGPHPPHGPDQACDDDTPRDGGQQCGAAHHGPASQVRILSSRAFDRHFHCVKDKLNMKWLSC
jgi:hypothetical protein